MYAVNTVRKSHSLHLAAVGVLLITLVLAQGLGIGFGPATARAAQASGVLSSAPAGNAGQAHKALGHPTTPLGSMLNPDGTLDASRHFSGSLDPSGWQLASEPGSAPRFVPDRARYTR